MDIYLSDFQVDILVKVLYLQELLYKWDLEKHMGSSTARLFTQNSDECLAGIVIWADPPYSETSTRGHWNHKKITKYIRYMLIQSRGAFSEGKKRLRQAHRPQRGGRDPKTDEHSHKSFILVQQMTIDHFNVDLLKASNMHTNISHAWIFISVIFYESVCLWICHVINVIFY